MEYFDCKCDQEANHSKIFACGYFDAIDFIDYNNKEYGKCKIYKSGYSQGLSFKLFDVEMYNKGMHDGLKGMLDECYNHNDDYLRGYESSLL